MIDGASGRTLQQGSAAIAPPSSNGAAKAPSDARSAYKSVVKSPRTHSAGPPDAQACRQFLETVWLMDAVGVADTLLQQPGGARGALGFLTNCQDSLGFVPHVLFDVLLSPAPRPSNSCGHRVLGVLGVLFVLQDDRRAHRGCHRRHAIVDVDSAGRHAVEWCRGRSGLRCPRGDAAAAQFVGPEPLGSLEVEAQTDCWRPGAAGVSWPSGSTGSAAVEAQRSRGAEVGGSAGIRARASASAKARASAKAAGHGCDGASAAWLGRARRSLRVGSFAAMERVRRSA